jgi:hypothetical protein
MPTLPGYKIWSNTTALTTAASPLVTGWFDTTGFTQLVISHLSAGGTTVFTVEGSFDGSTLDTDLTYTAVASSGTAATVLTVLHPYVRVRIVQTVGNATSTKVFVQARS